MTALEEGTLSDAERAHLSAGGRAVILFRPNIQEAGQVTRLTSEIACAAGQPVLIAVDHEMSPDVQRLSGGMVSDLPTPEEALTLPAGLVREAAQRLGHEMVNLGVNVDLAPVIDVVLVDNPALEGRHFGPDPAVVAAIGTEFIEGLTAAGVVSVPKHFPGHGSSRTDPHFEYAVIISDEEHLAAIDWPPFEAAFASGVGAVMIGHPVYTALDPYLPASLSPETYGLLRERFAFDGVAITDAMAMQAVAVLGEPGDLAIWALQAGADLLLFEDPEVVEMVVGAIVAAVMDGTLDSRRLIEAAHRVDVLAEWAAPVRCG